MMQGANLRGGLRNTPRNFFKQVKIYFSEPLVLSVSSLFILQTGRKAAVVLRQQSSNFPICYWKCRDIAVRLKTSIWFLLVCF